jgi:hypothetical protein
MALAVSAINPEGMPPSVSSRGTIQARFAAMGQPLRGHFDVPIVFGQQPQPLVAAFGHDGADDFSIVNIFYNFT